VYGPLISGDPAAIQPGIVRLFDAIFELYSRNDLTCCSSARSSFSVWTLWWIGWREQACRCSWRWGRWHKQRRRAPGPWSARRCGFRSRGRISWWWFGS